MEGLFEKHGDASTTKAYKHKTPCGTSQAEASKFMSLTKCDNEVEARSAAEKGYLRILGGLLWCAVMTMPDISYHTSHLAKFMQAPQMSAYEAAMNVLSYVYHRRHIGLTYSGQPEYNYIDGSILTAPEVHADASFGGNDAFPMMGGFVKWRHAAISWKATKPKTPPQSSSENELDAMVTMLKEAVLACEMIKFRGTEIKGKMITITDNKACLDIIENPGATKHTIHFARRLYFAREMYMLGKIAVHLVTTDRMMADDKTKALKEREKAFKCRAFQLNHERNEG